MQGKSANESKIFDELMLDSCEKPFTLNHSNSDIRVGPIIKEALPQTCERTTMEGPYRLHFMTHRRVENPDDPA